MTWIDDIGTYLQNNGIGTFAAGGDIFCNGFSVNAPNCITLLSAPGLPEKYSLRRTCILSRPELDVRVRNVDDATAEQKAKAIYELLHLIVGRTIGSTNFKKIRGMQDPYLLEIDDNDRYIYAVNFQLEINR